MADGQDLDSINTGDISTLDAIARDNTAKYNISSAQRLTDDQKKLLTADEKQALAKAIAELGDYGKAGNTDAQNAADLLKGRMDMANTFQIGVVRQEERTDLFRAQEDAMGPKAFHVSQQGTLVENSPTSNETSTIAGVVTELKNYQQQAFNVAEGGATPALDAGVQQSTAKGLGK